jgi:ankyrin repeat protein
MNLESLPLYHAAENGHEQVVRLLLDRSDVDVNMKRNVKITPLIVAAEKGFEGIVRALLEKPGIVPDLAGSHGKTALMCAAGEGYEAIVEHLLKRQDVDVDVDVTRHLFIVQPKGAMRVSPGFSCRGLILNQIYRMMLVTRL